MLVVGTGHRPDKLGGYGVDARRRLRTFCIGQLAEIFTDASTPKAVVSGMALGFDQALAEAAISLGIPLYAYIPFEGQDSVWPDESKKLYRQILNNAKQVIVVCSGGYDSWKMVKRNEVMVDLLQPNYGKLLALWNGDKSGGTFHCVSYALKSGCEIRNCWDEWVLFNK